MPRYNRIEDLPQAIRDVFPEGAQEIYLKVYDEAWDAHAEEYEPGQEGRDSVAHRKAWTAVSHEYDKDEQTGKWYHRGEKPRVEERKGKKRILDRLKELI